MAATAIFENLSTLSGAQLEVAELQGRAVLVVNIASLCGLRQLPVERPVRIQDVVLRRHRDGGEQQADEGASGSPRVAAIRDGAVSNRDDANRPLSLGELVDDAVGADAKRAEPSEPPPQHVAGQRIAFEQPERVLYGVDEGPAELK